MEKYIPYDKLSKKGKRKLDNLKRGTWGEINPVTRKPKTAKPTIEAKPGIGIVSITKPIPGLYFPFSSASTIAQLSG